MSPPASLRWDASNLLDVQVDHIARRAGQNRFAGIVGLPSRTGYRLGGHTGDRTTCLDTHHEPVAALRHQRSVTVGHSSGVFSCRKDDSAPPILTAQAPLPPGTPWLQPHSPQTTRPASTLNTMNDVVIPARRRACECPESSLFHVKPGPGVDLYGPRASHVRRQPCACSLSA